MTVVDLEFGLTLGDKNYTQVTLRELTSKDIIDAQAESERLVETPAGYQLVASPALVGANSLRRQIKKIGDIDGPLSLKDLGELNPFDLNKIQIACAKLEEAVACEIASRTVAHRGRTDS